MAVVVYRVYDIDATDVNDLEDYSFSVVATEEGAEYLIPDWANGDGLDADRIEASVARNYQDEEKPETAEDWADVAVDRVYGSIFLVEEEYESVEAAKEGEAEFANEAFLIKQDYLADADDNELMVDEDDEEEEE